MQPQFCRNSPLITSRVKKKHKKLHDMTYIRFNIYKTRDVKHSIKINIS